MASVSMRLCAGVRAAARSAFDASERELDGASLILRFALLRCQRRTESVPALGLGLLKLDVFALEASRHRSSPAILPG